MASRLTGRTVGEYAVAMAQRILLIEDSDDFRQIVSHYLGTHGYSVTTAENGRDGLAKARAEAFDLIITDLMLPILGGYEICTLLKQDSRYSSVPILVLTASKLQPKDRDLAVECGANDFCPKSLEPQALLEKVRELLAPHD